MAMPDLKIVCHLLVILHLINSPTLGSVLDYGCACGRRQISEEELAGCTESIQFNDADYDGSHERVLGGCEAGRIPWYVYIKIQLNGLETARCGGTLINKFWVLSAAHCFQPNYDLTGANYTMYIGVDKIDPQHLEESGNISDEPWKHQFGIAELVIHPLHNNIIEKNGKQYKRMDHDFALIRLDYPVYDEEHKIGILNMEDGFNKNTIMPICLPTLDLDDTKVEAKSCGVGIQNEKTICLTNSDGPEAFQRCAMHWRDPKEQIENKFDPITSSSEQGLRISGKNRFFRCNTDDPPPSKFDPLCVQFNEKVKELRKLDKEGKLVGAKLEVLQEYNITKESLLLPAANLSRLIRAGLNGVHCFPTEKEEYPDGWCATCNPNANRGQPGYCSEDKEKVYEPGEWAIALPSQGWGFCDETCTREHFSSVLRIISLTVLGDDTCEEIANIGKDSRDGSTLTVNIRAEICAAFVSTVNVSLMNYTQSVNNDLKDFSLLDLNNLKEDIELLDLNNLKEDIKPKRSAQSIFRSKRIKNNSNLPDFTARSSKIIGGADTCQGDSGGPLWIQSDLKNHKNETMVDVSVLIGVTSRGKGCGRVGLPAIYGRVKKIWKWIRTIADKPQVYTVKPIYGQEQETLPGKNVTVSPYCRVLANPDDS